MEYIEKAKETIRNSWFEKHEIKQTQGEEGFRKFVFGEKGTSMYQVEYVLSGNMVFVTGDLGDAAYSLTCRATVENIKDFNLSYFTGKITAHERSRWDFDDKLARKQIEEYILDWTDVENVDMLEEDDRDLYDELINATMDWSEHDSFANMGVWTAYNNTSVEWFDSESASCIADCGKRLNKAIIAYWVGLQMIAEQLENE